MTEQQEAQPEQLITIGKKQYPIEQARNAAKNSATWFWWVAGLSVINSVVSFFGWGYEMALGLGITKMLDAFVVVTERDLHQVSDVTRAIYLALVLAVAAGFYLLGAKARTLSVSAYKAGLILYAIDALLFLLVGDWLGLAFHAFVLYMLWGGYGITKSLRAVDAQAPSVAA